jgi:hypothetical protein
MPSCTLQFKPALRWMFNDDPQGRHVAAAIGDSSAYRMLRPKPLVLRLAPGTTVDLIERPSALHFLRVEFAALLISRLKSGPSWDAGVVRRAYRQSVDALMAPLRSALLAYFAKWPNAALAGSMLRPRHPP